MKVLILGHNGRLGNELMRVYKDLSPVGWDIEDLDITDEQAVHRRIAELQPNLVYNCAGLNDVDLAETDRVRAESVNGYAAGFVAKACSQVGATLVHFSTAMVFDGNNPAGYAEDDPTNPINAFGRGKLLGEMEAEGAADDLYIIRSAWMFGSPGPSDATDKSFTGKMIDQAVAGKPVSVVDDEMGSPTYTLDLAQASRALVEENRPFGIYHITNSGTASRLDWAREIFACRKLTPQILPIKGAMLERAAVRPKFEVLQNTKFLELRPWTEALREFLS